MKQITVLLADDHLVIRKGFRSLLETGGDFKVVGEAANGLQAVELALKLRPAVVVMDLSMPKLNGMEAARRILQQAAPPKVLILSAYDDDAYIEQAISLGASGYLIKQNSLDILSTAITEVYNGGSFYSPSIDKRLRDRQKGAPRQTHRSSRSGRKWKTDIHLT
ncbi:MAG TPA: DNA-binding response regulator [Lentisphaeria bacterium]|nr:DNA-binding response regulator [Lentisphaeria bacterium]